MFGQPPLHQRDLVSLGAADPLGHEAHRLAFGTFRHERGEGDRLGMVRDHPLHETDVGLRDARDEGTPGLLGIHHPARLPGAPGRTARPPAAPTVWHATGPAARTQGQHPGPWK